MKIYSVFMTIVLVCSMFCGLWLHAAVQIGKTKLVVVQGDITQQQGVAAIVNAANEHLQHGGGVARAIANAAGPELQDASNKIATDRGGKRCAAGGAVMTGSYNLAKIGIKNIIHAVGPDCRVKKQNEKREKLLRSSYTKSLALARKHDIRSIAFPAISVDIFGYDIKNATPVALSTIVEFVKTHPDAFDEIRFVLFVPGNQIKTQENCDIYMKSLRDIVQN